MAWLWCNTNWIHSDQMGMGNIQWQRIIHSIYSFRIYIILHKQRLCWIHVIIIVLMYHNVRMVCTHLLSFVRRLYPQKNFKGEERKHKIEAQKWVSTTGKCLNNYEWFMIQFLNWVRFVRRVQNTFRTYFLSAAPLESHVQWFEILWWATCRLLSRWEWQLYLNQKKKKTNENRKSKRWKSMVVLTNVDETKRYNNRFSWIN